MAESHSKDFLYDFQHCPVRNSKSTLSARGFTVHSRPRILEVSSYFLLFLCFCLYQSLRGTRLIQARMQKEFKIKKVTVVVDWSEP